MTKSNDFCSIFRALPNAVAFIKGSEAHPNIQGRVMFYQKNDGVIVRAEIVGLPKSTDKCANPIFAFHIHSGTECIDNAQDPFSTTGGHYNPNDCPHPFHAGDMPPLFSVKGKAFLVFLTDRFALNEILGKVVIIHSSADDFTTQPSGNAGQKIACGVITPTAR